MMRQMMKMMRNNYDDSDADVQKIRPWDMLMNITSENM